MRRTKLLKLTIGCLLAAALTACASCEPDPTREQMLFGGDDSDQLTETDEGSDAPAEEDDSGDDEEDVDESEQDTADTATGIVISCDRPTLTYRDQPGDGLRSGDVGEVGHIIDGDTLDLKLGGERYNVRVLGLNAPECEKEQDPRTWRYACSEDIEGRAVASYERAVELLSGENARVVCEGVEEGEPCPTDAFDRYLAYLELSCDRDFGEILVYEGLALTFTRYDSERRAEYCLAEYDARERRVGLWEGGSISSMLDQMSSSTRSWYRSHDERCDEAIEQLSPASP